jgi:hypothetical protein
MYITVLMPAFHEGIWIWNCKRSKKTSTPLATSTELNDSDTITESMDDNNSQTLLEDQPPTAEPLIQQKEEEKEAKEEKGKEESEQTEAAQQVYALKEEEAAEEEEEEAEEEIEIVPRRADRADSPPKNKNK